MSNTTVRFIFDVTDVLLLSCNICYILIVRLGYKWGKTDLTWDFLGGSSHVPADLVHKAAKKTFGMWSAKTPFRFDRVKSGQKVCPQCAYLDVFASSYTHRPVA